jgi:hypothetical protein
VHGRKLGSIDRAVAAMLALAWAVAGLAGLVAAYVYAAWPVVAAAVFALWYAVLWSRVAVQSRLLTWKEFVTPWRARAR